MIKPLELFVGLRYTRAKRRNHFISFISLMSMLGIALGIAVLITVISVMNGFEKELRERILGVVSHATVQSFSGQLQNWQQLAKKISESQSVEGAAPYIYAEGMLSYRESVNGTIVRGISPQHESSVSDFDSNMILGGLDGLNPGDFNIVLGKDLAYTLGVSLGDKLTLITPQSQFTAIGILPRLKRFTVVGLFEVGMYEYDSAMALVHIDDAAKLFNYDKAVSGLRLKLSDMFEAPKLSYELKGRLNASYRVTDWTEQHVNFFRAVKTEKVVMSLILFLIVAVAVFNLVSSLVMMVTDKQSDIAIMRTLGASPASIMGIFIIQGTLIGVIGTFLGIVGGVSLALNVETIVPAIERLFHVDFLAADVYYITELPSDMRWPDVLTISISALFLTLIATLYPAKRAAQIQPAEALRYE